MAGSFWYLRNLARVGNPFPAVEIDVGPLSLPSPPLPETFTVSHYLTDSDIWRDFYLPGLNTAFGEAWWALVALAVLGMLAAVIAGRPLERALGFAAIAAVAVYLVTPRSADGPEEVPFFFQFTLRYMTPGLVIGLALLPVVRPLSAVARRWWFYLGVGALLVVTLLDSGVRTGDMRRVALAAAFAVLAAAIVVAPRRLSRPALAAGVAGVLAIGAVAGYAVQRHYLATGIPATRSPSPASSATSGSPWSGSCAPTRSSGSASPTAWSRWPAGARTAPSCRSAAAAAGAPRSRTGGYRFVVTSPPLLPYSAEGVIFGAAFDPKTSPERRWTGSDPAATPIAREGKITVFRLDGAPDPGGCPAGRG